MTETRRTVWPAFRGLVVVVVVVVVVMARPQCVHNVRRRRRVGTSGGDDEKYKKKKKIVYYFMIFVFFCFYVREKSLGFLREYEHKTIIHSFFIFVRLSPHSALFGVYPAGSGRCSRHFENFGLNIFYFFFLFLSAINQVGAYRSVWALIPAQTHSCVATTGRINRVRIGQLLRTKRHRSFALRAREQKHYNESSSSVNGELTRQTNRIII